MPSPRVLRVGGFMLYVSGKPRATLTPDELLQFVRYGSVDVPLISEAEIEDKSKGDGSSKGITLLLVAQLVARYIQNVPTTLLEIDTLAVAALTCVVYGLWWKKPKDVGRPYIVHWKARGIAKRLNLRQGRFKLLRTCHIKPGTDNNGNPKLNF